MSVDNADSCRSHTLDRTRRSTPDEPAGLPLDAQLRPAASGHAHHAAARAEARRRDASSTPCPTSAICTRGFEKLGEHLDYNQYVTIVDRMNYISPMANNIAWHHAVEKLLGIELTPRCKYIRTIIARAGAHQRSPALQRRGGARHRGVHGVPVRLQPARSDLRHLRDAVGPAVPPQLHARRRPDVRRRRRWSIEKIRDVRPRLSQDARRHGAAAQPQSHLRRPHQGHRRADARKTRSTAAAPARSPGPAA